MSPAVTTIVMLLISNVFMTFAWYGHLKLQASGVSSNWPLWLVVVFSWGIALFEYSFMIPANRIGYQGNGGPFTLMQLKVIQEAVTLVVFTVVTMFVFGNETLRWNHVAAFLLLIMAVYLMFMDAK
ncbi:MAG: DMT family protein [Muribaculaceae bacterium]|nr:DMT family protein [Muribaculaceae bacterium]